ncbi:MAG TPA: GNAT family N-acetyltransferase [Tepidisphaeraceae bacterium]
MPAITLRRPTMKDVPEIARIIFVAFKTFHERHGFGLDIPSVEVATHFAGMLASHPKFYGVVAESEGRIVGSNFLDERDAIRGVGPITVDPGSQARGVGKKLMQAVIDRGLGAKGIRLLQDAFNATSMSLYTSLGFDAKEPVALMKGSCKTPPAAGSEVRRMTELDLPACGELCRKIHRFDRNGELADAIKQFGPVVLERGGRVVAYSSAPNFWIANHGVAASEQDMRDLFLGASKLTGQPLWLLMPIRSSSLFRWALSEGLRVMKPMTLMSMGEYYDPPSGCFFPAVAY